jgi:hypothetical protein
MTLKTIWEKLREIFTCGKKDDRVNIKKEFDEYLDKLV